MVTPQSLWIGQRLATARKLAGLTTRQLAERLSWNDHTRVVNYENGRRAVSVVTLLEIATVLGIPAAALLVESPEEQAVIAHVVGNRERAQQLAYRIALLGEPEPATPRAE
jgi:transcriptional regulator with XRE-family HTH domain